MEVAGDQRPKLLICADAGTHIGTGHVMRCVALAQAWQDAGGHAIFTLAMPAPALEARLRAEGMKLVHLSTQPGSAEDAYQTVDLARRTDASAVVLDGYYFDAEYQRIIKDAGLRLLFIDDYGHADYYWADLVLNQNIHAHAGLYTDQAPYTQLLLGTRYVLLRREFLQWREWEREIPAVARKVLVTLGGGDPDNATLKVIHALQQAQIDGLEAVVVVGGNNPHHEALNRAVQNAQVPTRLKRDVTDMPELMAWADVAVSAGGSTCWELAFMGLPNLVLVLAENQYPVAQGLDTAEVAVNLGWHKDLSAAEIVQALTNIMMNQKQRAGMAQRGRELVDGKGSARLVERIGNKSARVTASA